MLGDFLLHLFLLPMWDLYYIISKQLTLDFCDTIISITTKVEK